jgi:hypothetical protein
MFLREGAPGSDATIVQAIARLASIALQLASQVPPDDRLASIIHALAGVPGTRPKSSRIAGSIPIAVAGALATASRRPHREPTVTDQLHARSLTLLDGQIQRSGGRTDE